MLYKLENEIELVERHMSVLRAVLENGPVGIVSLSTRLGHPNHKIRYSLRRLEEEQLIEPSRTGAVATDRATERVSEYHERIEELIDRIEDLPTGDL